MIELIHGNCLEKMKDLPENSVDAIVTDPPYGLVFMGKEWDKGVPGVHFWVEMMRVLKPGGYLLAFSGTRTYHKMATAIEDGGFEIRDMINWVYGSGFPKSLNIGKAVDKLQGNERESIADPEAGRRNKTVSKFENTYGDIKDKTDFVTKGTSEWEGWGTALKPAHEPICMARKPLSEKTVAENCLKWGTGGINIDESRVGTTGARFNGRNVDSDIYGKYGTEKPKEVYDYGRFPANLIHDNSEEVRECFPEATKGGKPKTGSQGFNTEYVGGESIDKGINSTFYGSPGNASRFFKSIIYTAKASKRERGEGNNHCCVKPVALMEYLINMVTPKGGIVLDPFMGSGTTGVAAGNVGRSFIGIELDAGYFEIAKTRISPNTDLKGER